MELPDCPPGAEGYEDSVTEVPKKPDLDDTTCSKAELEFQKHLNSLKVKLEDGSLRCMVERRGRDISSNWIYLCYPCAAVCSGESILQTHISGKKHKTRLSLTKCWPVGIFETHPYILKENAVINNGAIEKINRKMAKEVIFHNNPTDFVKNDDKYKDKYDKYRNVVCHIQKSLDNVKAPLLGIEYLIEHPPEREYNEPSYLCTLCSKQGFPRTIVNHLTCFWHRCNYLGRHFQKADMKLIPHRRQPKFREGVQTIVTRLAQRIDDKFGRLKPVNIDKEEFEKDKEHILQWIFKSFHFSEDLGHTFEEVVDEELINSLSLPDPDNEEDKRNPSPPVVTAPTKPQSGNARAFARQRPRQDSAESLSDVSDENMRLDDYRHENDYPSYGDRPEASRKPYDLTPDKKVKVLRSQYFISIPKKIDKIKPTNYDYKMKLIEEKKQAAIEAARKTLTYYEKNPEKHPLYPEEWKKFWNKRYKEIQTEGKDPSKHDFKPEWISFWMKRMKELHEEELRVDVTELYRKMGLLPPELESYNDKKSDGGRRSPSGKRLAPTLRSSRSPIRRRSPDPRRRSPDLLRRRSPDLRKRSPDLRKRSPDLRKRSPDLRKRSPDLRKRSPDLRKRSPDLRKRFPDLRKRSPDLRKRSPGIRRSPDLVRRSPDPRRRSPDPRRRSPDPRRRSPYPRRGSPDPRRRSPDLRRRSPDFRTQPSDSRTKLPDLRRRSPDSRRRSPDYRARSPVSGRLSSDLHRHQSPSNRKSPFPRCRSPDKRNPSIDFRDRRSPAPQRRTPDDRRNPARSRSPLRKKSTSSDSERRADSPMTQRLVHRGVSLRHADRSVSPSHADRSVSSRDARPTPSMQTVLISDDELHPDDGLSPWNSDNDIESVDSVKDLRSRGGSVASRHSRSWPAPTVRPGSRAPHPAHIACPQDFGPTDNVIATLRLLVALEDYLGSLGPKIIDLLTEALRMEKEKANSSEELLDREAVVALLETAKEKLKGAVQAGLVTGTAAVAVRASVVRVAATLHDADTRQKSRTQLQSKSAANVEAAPVSVAGVGAVDRAEIAAQMAAALVAEGRTDVSPEELAQLVEAVVGMAEAKKREVEAKKQAQELSSYPAVGKSPTSSSSATTALQMLQSAYDERNGPTQKDNTSDAMDGLSDSDLETLLKNFNELSAEEQHSLIAYLKKLEVREPVRVEKLRQFVSAAAVDAPMPSLDTRPADVQPVTIESDDDDYTVEDVFKSATQKVKENQIQQEMEIVKKSLEETKTITETRTSATVEPMEIEPSSNVTQNITQSSAADLLALVQASIQSSSESTSTSAQQVADVVASSSQPRSFGDIPEMPMTGVECSPMPNNAQAEMTTYRNMHSPNSIQGSSTLHSPQNRMQVGAVSNNSNDTYKSNPNTHATDNNRTPLTADRQNPIMNNRQPYMGDSTQSSMPEGRHQLMQDTNRQPLLMQPLMGERPRVMHDNGQPLTSDNRQPLIDRRLPLLGDSRQGLMGDRLVSVANDKQPLMMDNRQSLQQHLPGANHEQSFMANNRDQVQSGYSNYNQDNSYNRGGWNNYRNGPMQNNYNYNYNQGPEMNQQNYNNYNKKINYGGHGGGFAGSRGRGRGRN